MSPSEIDSTRLPPQGQGSPWPNGVTAWRPSYQGLQVDLLPEGGRRLTWTRDFAPAGRLDLDAAGAAHLAGLLTGDCPASEGQDWQEVAAEHFAEFDPAARMDAAARRIEAGIAAAIAPGRAARTSAPTEPPDQDTGE